MRKLFYLMVLFGTFVFTACSNEVDPVVEDNQSDSLVYIHINCKSDYKVAAMTRGLTGDLASLCTSLDVYIQHNTNNTITEVHQVNTDDNFGDITVGLARGVYTINIIAHTDGEIERDGTYRYITYPTYDVNDTFTFYKSNQQVSADVTINATLSRAVAKFCLNITGTRVPEQVSKLKIKYNNVHTSVSANGLTHGDKVTGYAEKVFDITTHSENHFEFMLIPHHTTSTGGTMQVVVEALKEDNSVFETRTLEDVPVNVNHVTTYTGALFSDYYAGFNITVSPDWEGSIEGTF